MLEDLETSKREGKQARRPRSRFFFLGRLQICLSVCLGTICGFCLLLSAFCTVSPSTAAGPEENSFEPANIRRVLISPERVPEILARDKEGILVQLPRQEFEERVRRALRALESAKNPPRLIEARYRAGLMNTSLVGAAQWKMVNPAPVPGVLALQPFNLALTKASLRKAQFDNTEVILGNLDGKTLGLLLEQSGEQTASLNWSARGESGPSGIHFDLQIPSCPLASLELDLPADMIVMPSGREARLETRSLSTPHEGRNHWRIEFAGQSRVDLNIRTPTSDVARKPSLVLAQVQNTYHLRPEFVEADFEFKLEVPQQNLSKPLEFELDPLLQPIEVVASSLETWESPSQSKLRVRLKQPFLGGSILIRCLARLGSDQTWNSPGLHLVGAIPRGETIVFQIPADTQLQNWQTGDFRLTGSDLLGDGQQLITLSAANFNQEGSPKRPSARLNIPGPKYRVKQLAWWQIGPKESRLMVQSLYETLTGQLFQLPLLIPSGWEVDKVELFPAELLRNWTTVDGPGHRTLVVDLQRPLTSPIFTPLGPSGGLLPRLTVWLRPAGERSAPVVSRALPFPDVVPQGAEFRESLLAISVDPVFRARAEAVKAETAPGEKGPWGKQTPDFSFAFQNQPVQGTLSLQLRQPRVSARCNAAVVVTPRHLAMGVQIALQPEGPASNSIVLSWSAPVPPPVDWKIKQGSNRVLRTRRFREAEAAAQWAALSAPNVLYGLNCLSCQQVSSQLWVLTFDWPLTEAVTLETTMDLAASSNGKQFWDVPIPAVVGADVLAGELTLQQAGVDGLQVENTGLQQDHEEFGGGGQPSSQKFHYGSNPGTLRLRCQSARISTEPFVDSIRADWACLTTYLEPLGNLIYSFSFRMINWPQHTLPIRLPAGARPMSATLDGSWVDQLKWEETSDGTIVLELPVAAGRTWSEYQIAYSLDGPRRGLWSSVKAPLPELPVRRVLDLRRFWCLPPGISPLGEAGLHPLPGRSEMVQARNNRPLLPFQVLPVSLPESDGWADRQRGALVEAGVRWRNRLQDGGSITLGEGLELLATDLLKDERQLILDVRALRESGLTSVAAFSDAKANSALFPWELWGLVYVPCQPAPVLTTRFQSEAWKAAGQKIEGALASSVAQAVIHGHDSSGRFHTVADWIRTEETLPPHSSFNRPISSLSDLTDSRWTEWEQVAGRDPDESLVVVNRDFLLKLSVFLSLVLLLAAWQMRTAKNWIRWLLLLGWLAGGTFMLIWLPAPLPELARWPALTGWAVALFMFVKWQAVPAAGKVKLGGAATIGIAGCFVLGLPGQAAAPGPVIVYIVPGPADSPAKQTVLAPPEVLEKLRDLGDGILSSRRAPFLLSARYHGTVSPESADFTADFQVYSFGDGPFTLPIPLNEITIRDALLDGAPANPTVTPAIPGRSRDGFSLVIRHQGFHSIRFHFTAPVQAVGDTRMLAFKIPELAMSRLVLELPPGSSFPYAQGAKGGQFLVPTSGDGRSKEKKVRVEADLGQTRNLRVRWRRNEPKPGIVRLREAYLWDIQPNAPSLFAYLQYSINQGAVTNLVLDVPENMEVRHDPAVFKDSADDSHEPPPRLKDWYWSGADKQRRLILEFLRPVTGTLQVTLELIPRLPLGANPELLLPAPQGIQAAEGAVEHLLAYRAQGAESQLVANLRVTGIEQDAFRKEWASSGMADPGPEIHAFSFQREPGAPPFLRLKLTPPLTATTGVMNVIWRVRKNRADLTATVKVNSPTPELGLVEWEVPANLGVLAMNGPHVRTWSRSGSRIQVWFKGLVAETTLQLTGWVPIGQEKAKIPTSGIEGQKDKATTPSSPVPLRLSPLRVTPAQSLTTFVRIEGDRDLALEPANLKNLLPLPSPVAANREMSYVTDQSDYGGEILIRPSLPSVVRVLTYMDVTDRQVHFMSAIEVPAPSEGTRRFTVVLRNWQGEAQCEAREARIQADPMSPAGEHRWSVDLPVGLTGPLLIQVKGRAISRDVKTSLPDVTVEGDVRQQRWLALGPGLRGENPRGLLAVADVNSLLKSWPSQLDPVRQAKSIWEIQEANWRLDLFPRAGAPMRSSQVLLADQQAAVLDGNHWAYQADYLLSHANDLIIQFPTAADILEATVDGPAVTPLPLASGRWWVPLGGKRTAQTLRLRWVYDEGHLPIDQPILESPRLEEWPDFSAIWTVHVPGGFLIERPPASAQEITASDKFLRAAEAQLQLSILLAKEGFDNDHSENSSLLQDTQERFYLYCGLAEHWLTLANASHAGLQEIRQRNRKQAGTLGFDKIRQRAEELARFDPLALGRIKDTEASPLLGGFLTERGTPTYWLVNPGAGALRLHLTTYERRKIEAATSATGVVTVILLTVLVLSCIPKARGLLRIVGPELMIFLGCLGWWRAEPDWSFVVLIIVGLVARFLSLFRAWGTSPQPTGKDPESAIRRREQSIRPSVAGSS